MQYNSSKRPIPLLALVWALVVAASGFLFGRLSVRKAGCSEDDAEQEPPQATLKQHVERALSQSTSGWHPVSKDWDALAEAAGLLDSRPPLPPGETGSAQYVVAPFQIISWHPRIVYYPNFIDKERAQEIVRVAQSRLQKSQLALRKSDQRDENQQVRTSHGTFLSSSMDPTEGKVLQWLDDKISAVTNIPKQQFEAFNVLRYELTQHYDAHHDYFQESMYGPQKSNRMATVLIYLEAPDEGGETIFPLEGINGEQNMKDYNYKTCDRGYLFKGRPGDAVLFYSVDTTNVFDKQSLHGGCPVQAGSKWVLTKWIRDQKHFGN